MEFVDLDFVNNETFCYNSLNNLLTWAIDVLFAIELLAELQCYFLKRILFMTNLYF